MTPLSVLSAPTKSTKSVLFGAISACGRLNEEDETAEPLPPARGMLDSVACGSSKLVTNTVLSSTARILRARTAQQGEEGHGMLRLVVGSEPSLGAGVHRGIRAAVGAGGRIHSPAASSFRLPAAAAATAAAAAAAAGASSGVAAVLVDERFIQGPEATRRSQQQGQQGTNQEPQYGPDATGAQHVGRHDSIA